MWAVLAVAAIDGEQLDVAEIALASINEVLHLLMLSNLYASHAPVVG